MLMNSLANLSQLKISITRFLPAFPNFTLSDSSSISSVNFLIHPSASPSSTRKPVLLSYTISGIPPTLDATTGQNALNQVEIFKEMAEISGLIVTKLDGSAKGGILLSLAEKFNLPVHAIGVGEKIEDLQSFEAQEFANSLMGLEK